MLEMFKSLREKLTYALHNLGETEAEIKKEVESLEL